MAMNPSVFKEDPCSILMGKNLESKAYKTAVAFVPSMRMKVWKPKEENKSSNAFCYMETDKYSFPTKEVCNTDTLFGGKVPFIKSAFFDNKLEKTKTFPEDKCVFEIDRANLTDGELNKFWTKINDLECKGQFAEYQQSNVILEAEIESLKGEIRVQEGIKGRLINDISSANVIFDKQKLDYQALQKKIGDVTSENDRLIEKGRQVKVLIQQYFAESSRFWESYTSSSNVVVKQIVDVTQQIESQRGTLEYNLNQIEVIQKAIGKQNLKNSELVNAYSNIKEQFEKTFVENLQVSSNLVIEKGKYAACKTNLQKVTADLNACLPALEEKKKRHGGLVGQFNKCSQDYLACTNTLEKCLSNQAVLTGTNNSLIIKYQKLVDIYDVCIGVQSNLVSQSNALGIAIKDWLATHYICDFQVQSLKTLDMQKETLQKTCRVADKTAYDTTLMSAQATLAQVAADQVTTCVDNKNTMYTSIPVPPSAPVDSNQSRSFANISNVYLPTVVPKAPKFKKGVDAGATGGDNGWGNQFNFVCDDGSYVEEINGRWGKYLDQISVVCQGGKKSEKYGGGGGQAFSYSQSDGFNQLRYWGGWYLDHLAIYDINGKLLGANAQNGNIYKCPPGEKIMGIHGGWGAHRAYVNRLGFFCTDMAGQQRSCP